MNRLLRAAAAAAMIAFAPMCGAQVMAGGTMTSESDAVLTLVSVDPLSNTAVLRAADGWGVSLDMPEDAHRLQRAKPGALFRMHLVESLGLEIEKGGTPGAFEDQRVTLAPPGATPAIEVVTTRRLVLRVQAVDAAGGRITLQNARGAVTTFVYSGLLENADAMAAGDTFSLIRVEALTLEMLPGQMQTSR